MSRQIIVTADDFGRDEAVNAAVERAHRDGILTGASLMVGAPAAADAVARARRLPSLAVGLHLALVDADPVLSAERIPDLIGNDGRLRGGLVGAGVNWFLRPAARRQLRLEIEAQFQAFAATGLPLDHLNGHHHMHVHPTVSRLVVEVGRQFGLRAVRLPLESPSSPGNASTGGDAAGWRPRVMRPWARYLQRRLTRAGLVSTERLFGLRWSGRMTERRWLDLLTGLPEGASEIYCHPSSPLPADGATAGVSAGAAVRNDERMAGQRELEALTSAAVRAAIREGDIHLTTFAEVTRQRCTDAR